MINLQLQTTDLNTTQRYRPRATSTRRERAQLGEMDARFYDRDAAWDDDDFHDELLAAVTSQRALHRIITSMRAMPGRTATDDEALGSAETELKTLSKFVNIFLTTEYFNEQIPPHATNTAQKVFVIPELLELILSQLHALELLKTQATNRQFYDAIEKSTRLQRALSLQVVPGKHFSTHFFGVEVLGLLQRC